MLRTTIKFDLIVWRDDIVLMFDVRRREINYYQPQKQRNRRMFSKQKCVNWYKSMSPCWSRQISAMHTHTHHTQFTIRNAKQ